MVCFRPKKEQPMWFILDEPKYGKPPSRQGPYSHETFVKLMSQQKVESTQLIWTNERIFPNRSKPRSNRLVRLTEWRRIDQFPDPTLRKLQLEAQNVSIHNTTNSGSVLPIHGTPAPEEIPPIPPPQQQQQHQQQQPPPQQYYQPQHPPPPSQQPPPSYYPNQQQPQYFNPHQPLPPPQN